MVADGDTAVIGGLLKNTTTEDETKVPVLGDIPILGWLFRKKEEVVVQRNMTIFITPRIVDLDDEDELEDVKLRIREQLSGLKLRKSEDEQGNTLGQ